MTGNEFELAKNGIGVSIGLMIVFFAVETLHWHNYLEANPSVTNLSTSSGFMVFYAGLFFIGAIICYVFFVRGFESIATS